jgi:biopolymer transport protein ExbD
MGMSMAGGGASGPEMNVTPLIDVLLVLIIIFMIVVTQEQRSGLKAQIPQPAEDSQAPQNPERTIVIRLLYGGEKQEPSLKINTDECGLRAVLKIQLATTSSRRAPNALAFVRGR